MYSKRRRLVRLMVSLAAAGAIFQISGCVPDGTLQFLKNFNLGGTVLNVDPLTYQFYTSGYDGPGVDIDVDPACTYPPYCNVYTPGIDPFSP